MNNAAANNTISFYDQYKNAGISYELLLAVTIRSVLAFVGIFMNLALVIVTIRSKSLRSICNILIALDTASVTLYLPINIVGLGVVATGTNFIPSSLCCFIIQPIPLLGLNISIMAIFFVALDRFLSVFQPVWHSTRKKSTYIFFISIFCMLYSIYTAQMILGSVKGSSPVVCSLASDCMQNGVASQFSTNVLIVNGTTVGFYIGLWLLMEYRAKWSSSATENVIAYTRRIFKSLTVLISFYMVSYSINSLIRIWIYPRLNLTPVQAFLASSYLTAFSILSQICNGPILYAFSTEYRKAFNQIFGLKYEPNVIHVMPPSTTRQSIQNIVVLNK